MSDTVERAMAQFPGPVVLRSSETVIRRLFFAVTLGGLLLVGYFAVAQGGVLWLVLFPVALMFVLAAGALPGNNTLTLQASGFELRFLGLWRTRVGWADAGDFAFITVRGGTLVAYNDASRAGRAIAKLNVAAMGRTSNLPDNYGFSPDDLAELMIRWRAQAIEGARAFADAAAPSVANRVIVSKPLQRGVRGGMLALRIIVIVLAVLLVLARIGYMLHG